ncbi:MAG: cysteine desulfurase-like protein [Acidimicrobiia bacterium]
MELDAISIRSRFPALSRTLDGRPVIWADGPGGTQVPESVIDAMSGYLRRGGSNHGGFFEASRDSDEVHREARSALADFLGASSHNEIAFGQNMTSLTFAVSRALARTWDSSSEVVATRLDHDANVTPWVMAAADSGATVRKVDVDPSNASLDMDSMESAIGPNTRLVAVTAASNASGSLVDVRRVVEMAHAVGAIAYVDAVHLAPHRTIDVAALDCDFLVVSAYKFFGPHTGVLYGKYDRLDQFDAYKVRPAPELPPGKWETGTQSFESFAGLIATIEYWAELGEQVSPTGIALTRRDRLVAATTATSGYERGLARRFLDGVADLPRVEVYGITEGDLTDRTPTFALAVAGTHPDEVAANLGAQGIFVWSGNYYAVEIMEALGRADSGGLVRIGFVHYNTAAEVDRILEALAAL